MRLRAEDIGGTIRDLFQGDPDGSAILYHLGLAQLRTEHNGIRCPDGGYRHTVLQLTGTSSTLAPDTHGNRWLHFNTGAVTHAATLLSNASVAPDWATGDHFWIGSQAGTLNLNFAAGVSVNNDPTPTQRNIPNGQTNWYVNIGPDSWIERQFTT